MKIKKEDFIKDYETLTYEELSEKYSVSRSVIYNLIKELGLNKKVGRKSKVTFD